MKKKILSILLAVSLVSSSFTAVAAEAGSQETVEAESGIAPLADYTGAPVEIIVGEDIPLSTQIQSSRGVTWSVSDSNIANVNNIGVVTGVSVGTTTVTAKENKIFGASTETFAITVISATVAGDPVSIVAGSSTEALSTEGLVDPITWTSAANEIATVDNGVVTGVAAGMTTVTATDSRGRTKTFEVTVTGPENPKISVMVKDSKTLSTEGLTEPITWTTADDTVATVADGVVTGVKLDRTTVTATDVTGKTVTFDVSVTELQYFNTNIFDYKEGSKGTLIAEERKHFKALTGDGVHYLTAEDLKDSKSSWGNVGIDQCGACAYDQANWPADPPKDVTIGTLPYKDDTKFIVTYDKGITMHADGSATIDVPADATQFTAVAAVNKCQTGLNSSMTFRVTKLDATGKTMDNPVNYIVGNGDIFDSRAKMVDVDVTGVASIKLEVLKETGINGSNETNANDHGVWADAKFTVEEIDQSERMGNKAVYDEVTSFKGINDYTYELNNNTRAGLYFTGGVNQGNYTILGSQNAWTGENGGIYAGIASANLVDSTIKFGNYVEPGLFVPLSNSAKDVFTNVKFPFVLDPDGYYTFDSQNMDAAFENGIGVNDATLEWYEGSAVYDQVKQTDGDKTGFFPFNDTKGAAEYKEYNLNYWFGMSQSVDFYMLNGGFMDEPNGKEPIIFEFSGDDDVWVYVDGKLVLDLGGIHDRASGVINFGTRKITVEPANGNAVTTELNDILGDTWGMTDDEELHSLQIFYLERGKGASNLKVRFNLPQRDQLVVEKAFDNTGLNSEEEDELLEKKFTYKVTCDGEVFANQPFVLFDNGAIKNRDMRTNADGEFELKYKQRAVFTLEMPRPQAHTYQVEEIFNEPNFTTTWGLKRNKEEFGSGKGKLASEVTIGKKEHYDRKNVDVYTYTFHNYRDTVLADDTVVIDYGKKIPIDVFANDGTEGNGKIYTKREMTLDSPIGSNGIFIENKNKARLEFIPSAFMDEIETTNYSVVDAKNETKTAKVTVIPATTVYYEDDFGGNNGVITYDGNWNVEGTSTSSDYQDDGTVGEGNTPYGQDSTYADDAQFSGGSAHWIEGKLVTGEDGKPVKDENGKYQYLSKASFEFKGTGFDLISRTDPDCGMITAEIQKWDESAGEWRTATPISVLNKGENTLYQIPVITYDAKEYGTYKVTITVKAASDLMGYKGKFYLDAIRLYNPMGLNADDNTGFKEANAAYNTDNEANAQFISLRDKLITESGDGIGVELGTNYTNGMVWVDSLGKINDNTDNNIIVLDAYKTVGPNREVYLSPQCAIGFKLTVDKKPVSVQIGAKAPKNGVSSWVAASTNSTDAVIGDLETATDMYYDVTDSIDWIQEDDKYTATVYIANTSVAADVDNILSLTNLKLTYAEPAAEPVFQSNVTVVREVLRCMAAPADTYVPDYEITSAAFTADKVKYNKEAVIVVKTSKDVEELVLLDANGNVVKPVSVEAELDESLIGTEQNGSAKTWKVTVKAKQSGILTYQLYGVSSDNNISETKVEVSVEVVRGNIKDTSNSRHQSGGVKK